MVWMWNRFRASCLWFFLGGGGGVWFLTDLDFADNITLLSGTMANAQTLQTAIKENAAAVGWHINMKTEYIRIGDFSSNNHPALRVSGGKLLR